MTAKTYRRKKAAPKRRIRAIKDGAARDAIGTLEPGCNIYVLTFGQFSLIDALCEIIRQTGPADVAMATWSAAAADLERAKALVEASQIRSMRLIVDRSFLTVKPDWCRTMRKLYGDDCIRATRTHAKWILIRNEKWNIVVRTSMNMNMNPRLENMEISDDPDFADFMELVADELFRELPPATFDSSPPPLLAGLDWAVPAGRASAGSIDLQGLARPSVD